MKAKEGAVAGKEEYQKEGKEGINKGNQRGDE